MDGILQGAQGLMDGLKKEPKRGVLGLASFFGVALVAKYLFSGRRKKKKSSRRTRRRDDFSDQVGIHVRVPVYFG